MPPRTSAPSAVPRHPIQVVARRTGLSADVIRAWEKRYGVVTPVRSAAGQRLYADADIQRLQLLARATRSGRTIGQLAPLAAPALAALVHADASVELGATSDVSTIAADADLAALEAATAEHAAACLDALTRFDIVALDAALRRAAVALSAEAFLDTLVVPFWAAVLEGVRGGLLRVAHEPLALAALRRALDRVVEAATSPLARLDLVITTPAGQSQELGALLTAAAAAAEGWRALDVGPGVPAEVIADATTQLGARAVTLSLGTAAGDRSIPRELRRLRTLLPADVAILVEGAAAHAHRGVIREIDATALRDLSALRTRLRALRELRPA